MKRELSFHLEYNTTPKVSSNNKLKKGNYSSNNLIVSPSASSLPALLD